MGGEDLTIALGGSWHGSYGIARCPAHDDRRPSLRISEGDDGRPLVYCNSGCEQAAVIGALKARGLWPGRGDVVSIDPTVVRRREAEKERRKAEATGIARALWRRCRPAAGTPVETYLRSRGLTGPIPPTLRYHASARHRATGLHLPCMVAAVSVAPGREVVAVHRTFLVADGSRKAPVSPDRMMLAPCKGGAVRLAPAGPVLAISEGIETGLSVQQATGIPTWAALSSSGIETLILPPLPFAAEVDICADNDLSGAGQRAAEVAAERWSAEGRRVRIVPPPDPGTDWNDILMAAAAAKEIA